MKDNLVLEKSKKFAVRIIKFYDYLCEEKKAYVIAKQILRSGTSIGANVRESVNAQSKSDFVSKMNIALKEAGETMYWLEILNDSDKISEKEFGSLYEDAAELAKLLSAIVKTTRKVSIKE